jgi:pimeloyl-ACP methyl ester carboxylesterase
MPHFQFDDLNVFYDIKGEGEPLLMLHGNSVSSKMFASEIDYWAGKGRKVIVMDYPGLGQSDRVPIFRDDYWLYNSHAVDTLLEHIGIDSVDIVGTSGGALTGLNLATHYPKRIKTLIADSFMGHGLSKEEADTIAKRRTRAKDKVLSTAFWKAMNGEDWSKVVDQDIDLMRRVGHTPLETIHGDLSKIDFPVLCVGSYEDELIPDMVYKMKEVSSEIPKCEEIYYDYGKHPFMITQKPEFRKVMEEFYSRLSR